MRLIILKVGRIRHSYLFFDILELLLELLDVRVAVIAAAVVHERALSRCGAGRPPSFGTDRAAAAGRKGDLVVEAAADHIWDDAIDLRAALDAFLHKSGTAVAGAHVAARPEQDRRLLV